MLGLYCCMLGLYCWIWDVRVCTQGWTTCCIVHLSQDLRACSAALAADPGSAPDGSAPFYGMAASMPDRRLVGDFLEAYQDALLDAS